MDSLATQFLRGCFTYFLPLPFLVRERRALLLRVFLRPNNSFTAILACRVTDVPILSNPVSPSHVTCLAVSVTAETDSLLAITACFNGEYKRRNTAVLGAIY